MQRRECVVDVLTITHQLISLNAINFNQARSDTFLLLLHSAAHCTKMGKKKKSTHKSRHRKYLVEMQSIQCDLCWIKIDSISFVYQTIPHSLSHIATFEQCLEIVCMHNYNMLWRSNNDSFSCLIIFCDLYLIVEAKERSLKDKQIERKVTLEHAACRCYNLNRSITIRSLRWKKVNKMGMKWQFM